jgi:hypothetical protein
MDIVAKKTKVANQKRLIYYFGFYEEESNDKESFRWSENHSAILIGNIRRLVLKISSYFPVKYKETEIIRIYGSNDVGKSLLQTIALTKGNNCVTITIEELENLSTIYFYSDSTFSPEWYGASDNRLLSFMITVIQMF